MSDRTLKAGIAALKFGIQRLERLRGLAPRR